MAISHSNPVTGHNRRAVGVFPNRHAAEQALYALRDSGFPMDRVSVITKDNIRESEIAGADVQDSVSESRAAQHVDNKAEEGAAVGITTGGVLGGLTGLLVGLGTLAIPGIGPVMLAGAAATTLATTLAGTAIGAATVGLLGALIGLGIPEEDAKVYNERIGRGEYLIIIDGNEADIAHAHQILSRHHIEEYKVYDAPGVASATPAHLNQDITPHHHHEHSVAVNRNKHAVGVFSNPRDAEHAITDLRNAGFPLSQISIVSNQPRRNTFTDVDLRDRFDAMRYGIPVEQAKAYNDRLDRGDYIVIVSGTDEEVRQAEAILRHHNIEQWQIYDPTVISSAVGRNKHAVGVFSNPRDTEHAITDLRNAGFPLSQISLVSNHPRRNSFTDVDLRDRFDAMRYGIPVERARVYNDRLDRGDYIVIVSGTEEEVRQAEAILRHHKIEQWQVYDPTVISSTTPVEHSRPLEMSAPLEGSRPLEHTRSVERSHPNIAKVAPVAGPAAYPVTPVTTSTTTPITDERSHHPYKRAIGVFHHRHDAEMALTDLRDSGFPMGRVSVIAKDIDQNHPLTSAGQQNLGVDLDPRTHANQADEGAKAGAATGAALGGLGGLLVGLGTLAIPGIGPVIAGGAAATALATALSGGAIGAVAGGATGGLVGLGIPENRAHVYNDHLNRGDYLIMVDGFEEELRRAEPIFKRHSIHEWEIYNAADVDVSAYTNPNPYIPRPSSKSVERDRTNSTW